MLISTVVVTMTLLDYIPNIVAVFGVMTFVVFSRSVLDQFRGSSSAKCLTPSKGKGGEGGGRGTHGYTR